MKLISMTDFVFDQFSKLEKTQEINILQFRNNIGNYANFLKQPLKMWMFVPCDLDDNVIEEQLIKIADVFDTRQNPIKIKRNK